MDIEKLKAKKEALEKRIAAARAAQNGARRKAETHIKATLGGAVFSLLQDAAVSEDDKAAFRLAISVADPHIQKEGQARDMFNALKQKLGV